jgi:4'-phosphopantetheinyl transferase
LNDPQRIFPEGARVLSEDELGRAMRFRRHRDARHWAEGRAWVRQVLGGYTGCEPAGVSFGFGQYGKPFLKGMGAGLSFNLTHAGDWIALAVGRVALGVDMEDLGSEELALELEGEVFGPVELDRLRGFDSGIRREMFFEGWVRKEALLKATGAGLSMPLTRLEVLGLSERGEQPVSFRVKDDSAPRVQGATGEYGGFSLWDFRVGADVVGAVAVRHPRPRFTRWSWVE